VLIGVPDETTLNRWNVMRSRVYDACGVTSKGSGSQGRNSACPKW